MEFFRCPCPAKGNVILNGNNLGPNRDCAGNLLTKQCNAGLHIIMLRCSAGKRCTPPHVTIEITDTAPISPREVAFQCEGLLVEKIPPGMDRGGIGAGT